MMTTELADELLLKQIETKFNYKRKIAKSRERELFSVFELSLTNEERMSLQFLYAYMPLHDLADYDGEFFLKHVRRTLETRELAPWGSKIPDYIFLNFVLPYRVNNENIDNNREVIFHELFDRVKDKSMKEAIMEANYWCHERATYIGSDMRTISPLTLMQNTLGRCGEQSTLAVAALRSLGIPARQCYTPRWAHCDSNHAWVEAWADGEWYFLGACEPEGRLNEGWFRAPSRRAMLVNTRVSADYSGPEPVCSEHPWYTEINLLSNYAPHKTITIKVVDEEGQAVRADVHFQMYNFAEFFSITTLPTNDKGEVQFTTGFGDLLIHVKNEKGWGYRKISVGDADVFEVVLQSNPEQIGTEDFMMTAPVAIPDSNEDLISDEEREANDIRVQHGTAIRAAFEEKHFWTEEQSNELAEALSLPQERVWKVLQTARGNSSTIASFLREQTPVYGEMALQLLESLRPKDLQDTMKLTLEDHLIGAAPFASQIEDESLFITYVLCPRVHFEMLVPYRAFFQAKMTDTEKAVYAQYPQTLVERIAEEITLNNEMDRYLGMATPVGVFSLKHADRVSRNICFVSIARSIGIPARFEPLNARPQYWHAGQWHDAVFEAAHEEKEAGSTANGCVQFSRGTESDQEAAYHTNFTLAILENKLYRTLTIPKGEKEIYDKPIEVMSGDYRLTTGTRLSDGSVLVRFSYFRVEPGETALVPIEFRKEEISVPVLDTLTDEQCQALSNVVDIAASEQGTVLAWLDPEREPSKHLAREMRELKAELDQWGGRIVLLVEEARNRGEFSLEGLPQAATYQVDTDAACLNALRSSIQDWNGQEYPLVLVIDGQHRIRYQFQGYKLGIGTDIVKTLNHMEP